MRTLLLAAAGVLLLAGPTFAKDAKPPSCTAQWNAKSDADKAATTRKAFMAGCKESNAAAPAAPATTAMAPAAMAPATGAKPLSCTKQWNAKSDADKAATTRKAFMAGCKGDDTAAAATGAAPAATAAVVPAKGAKAPSCTAQWNAKSDTDKAATTRKAFMAGCKETNAAAAVAPATMAPAKPAMVPAKPAMVPTAAPSVAPVKPAMVPATAPTAVKPATNTMAPVAPPTTMKAAGTPAVTPTGAAPEGATGVCKDGTYTKSKGHSGACSHHGGVAKWL